MGRKSDPRLLITALMPNSLYSKRIRLNLAPDLQVEFVDRDLALKRIVDWAERGGTYPVQVIYGPEGCGKTAWLLQAVELLKDYGFNVIYVNPIEQEFMAEIDVEDIKRRLIDILREATGDAWARTVWAIIDLARELIRVRRGKLAVIVDDAFQVIGLDKAAIYVKGGLLGLIEHPPETYERVVAIAATSEGVSRREIGRHTWANQRAMWNMPREGLKQLYDQLPGEKPGFEEVWRLTGGNPRMLGRLYETGWNAEAVIGDLRDEKGLNTFTASLTGEERLWLEEAINDPDTLMSRERIPLMNRLVELNLIIDNLPDRDPRPWIDTPPPPKKDPELGIGKYVAWQSPLHREAVRRALEGVKP